jgi:hypothetical protein
VTSAAYVKLAPADAEAVQPADEAQQVDPVPPVLAAPVAPEAGPDPVDPPRPAEATTVRETDVRPAAPAPAPRPTVAAAVAHALAARAAANREPVEPVVPSRTADARDRLLAVLLADPVRAVGAAEELATCRGQLGDVLARLAASGLTTDQLARLSGFSAEQITTLLDRQNA